MQLDVDAEYELPDDYPAVQELTQEEAKLYWSAVRAVGEAVEKIAKQEQRTGEINLDVPELAGIGKTVQDTCLLAELIEELAVWRQCGVDWLENSPQNVRWAESSGGSLDVDGGTDD